MLFKLHGEVLQNAKFTNFPVFPEKFLKPFSLSSLQLLTLNYLWNVFVLTHYDLYPHIEQIY